VVVLVVAAVVVVAAVLVVVVVDVVVEVAVTVGALDPMADGALESASFVVTVSDPQAAAPITTRPTTNASDAVRFTDATVSDRPGATLAPMGVAGVRFLTGVVGTVAAASLGAACGADGPRTTMERGEAIYGANCAQCHGGDLAGTERGPSLLLPIYGPDQLSDVEFADAIRNGVEERLWEFGPMPANKAITDEQIDAILTFVRARQADDPGA
jgi:mono/diheme cytochrome c family protein